MTAGHLAHTPAIIEAWPFPARQTPILHWRPPGHPADAKAQQIGDKSVFLHCSANVNQSTDNFPSAPDDRVITQALVEAMEAKLFLTPTLHVDGTKLAFVGPIEAGREAETFATLLTFTTFSEKPETVIDEAYTAACAETGVSVRLDEDRWYDVAREYFEEFLEQLDGAPVIELQAHLAWLDLHFFARHAGYDDARIMIERYLATRGNPLH